MKKKDFSNKNLKEKDASVITDNSLENSETNEDVVKVQNSGQNDSSQAEVEEITNGMETDDGSSPNNVDKKPISNTEKGKLRNIIITSTVCAVALTAGISLGVFFGKGLFTQMGAMPTGDWKPFEEDITPIYEKYKALGSKAEVKDKFRPYEIVNLAIYEFEQTKNHQSVVIGMSYPDQGHAFDQKIRTFNIRHGDELFCESVSDGAVPVGKRFTSNLKKGYTYEYTGQIRKGTNGEAADWDVGNKIEYKNSDFEETWGKTLDKNNIYSISTKSVTKEELRIDENGDYVISLIMDPESSNKRYARQMNEMSHLNERPVFNELKLDYVIDNQLKIKTKSVNEIYVVKKFGFSSTTKTEITEYYSYSEDSEITPIPNFNTDLNYGGNKNG